MIKKHPLLQNFSALGIGCLLLGALSGPVLADSDVAPSPESCESLLRPVKVVSTTGNVSNAEALIEGHGGSATLTMVQGGAAPMIILDYGRDVGGIPFFDVNAVSGTPKLQAIYSESMAYLLPYGDTFNQVPTVTQPEVSFVGDAAGADLSRVDAYPLRQPGLIVNRLFQGGERFEAITLTSPGSVTLRRVGIQAKFFIPQPTANRGSFRCSDPALNEIWHLGRYAVELCSVPAQSLVPKWTVTSDGVKVPGNEYCGYQGGATWTDYTETFDVQVLANEASWLVRATEFNGIRMVLAADNDVLGTNKPNTLRAYVQFTFGPTLVPLGMATLPDIKPGSWHRVRNEVNGSTANIFLDGALILTINIPDFAGNPFLTLATGEVSFGNQQGAEALFRNLLVIDPSGNVLYQSSLTDPSILDQFAAGTNVLPSIMDGAKRDRFDYTGDIGISGLTLLYSTFAREYLAGCIELFSDYQRPEGRIPTFVPPQYRPGVTSAAAINATSLLIPDYDIEQVTSIYHYYLYTGDKAFLQTQWPVVQKVIAFFNSLTNNPQHLLIFPSSSADTLTNAHFYGVLLQGALLGEALDHADVAASYRATAAQLKVAINTNLFNNTTGLYDVSTSQRGVAPQDGNSYAILYGVAPAQGTSVAAILERLTTALYRTPTAPNATGPVPVQQSSGSTQVGPYTSAYELFARFENDDTANALALIRNEWGLMRKNSPSYSGATWEYVALDGTPGLGMTTSLAHGWSSGPTSALSKYVLGGRPIQPGYKTWLVEPQPGDLSWATGTVPTPYGPIAVGWRKNGNSFEVTISVPRGTSGTVGIPSASGAVSVTDNGHVIKSISASNVSNGRAGYVYVQNLQPGEHVIRTTK
jgi:alpha-L-rhamnosidase